MVMNDFVDYCIGIAFLIIAISIVMIALDLVTGVIK